MKVWPWYYNERWDEKKKKNPSSRCKRVEQSHNGTYSAAFTALPSPCQMYDPHISGVTVVVCTLVPALHACCSGLLWSLESMLYAITSDRQTPNRSKLSAAQILYFPSSVFCSGSLNVKWMYIGLVSMHSAPPGPFCLKLKNWKEAGDIGFFGFMVVRFLYIAFAVTKLAD